MQVLQDVKRIKFNYFNSRDVVRHQLVQHIIDAYDSHEEQETPDNK